MTTPEPLPRPFIPLHASDPDLQDVGGKAVNLSRLAQAGFQVPNGFFIPTECYRDFVERHQLAREIGEALARVDPENPESYQAASDRIRSAFRAAPVDSGFASSLGLAWRWLGAGAVAVRSSATAEDLPGASFAGQQDTFLNILGQVALIESVVECWSSLWTGRAMSYRDRNEIGHEEAALAVVVQVMVPAEASGVMFTSNPISGLRSELVIDATLGLGEGLVGGLVEPDHYVVTKGSRNAIEVSLGAKAVALHSDPGGGLREERKTQSRRQALPDEIIRELARRGEEIEQVFGFPQDVEWAYLPGNGRIQTSLSILQARPITSLYPLPPGTLPEPIRVMFSFGAVQGMLDPMTPLGQDVLRLIFAGAASLFGVERDHETQGVIRVAGERLWVDITGLVRHPLGARVVPRLFAGVEPGSSDALRLILDDPGIRAGSGPVRLRALLRIAAFAVVRLWSALKVARHPENKAEAIRATYQKAVGDLKQRSRDLAARTNSLERALSLYQELANAFVFAVPEIAVGAFAGLLPLMPLSLMSRHLTGSNDIALQVTRGLPHNVTTEMDLALWERAREIGSDSEARAHLASRPAGDLSHEYHEGALPAPAQKSIRLFLEQYGMRGLGEIDIGRKRWREDPTPVLQTLQSYLQIDQPEMAPDAVFQRGRIAANGAVDALAKAARGTFAGRLKAAFIHSAVRRIRALAGLRESPKFYIIQVMGVIRAALLEAGEDLARSGVLDRAEDIFFLNFNELEEMAGGQQRDWPGIVATRRESYRRELLRRQVPRILLSDGRAFYQGILSGERQDGKLRGSPVSPGVAEGVVRVVRDPHNANLQPGEVLVCPGTDPAWTPLFLAAAGLVMEVGGMMTHGAIVAREYGIPAVVGVDRATDQLRTGQRVRIDGSQGLIELLDQPAAQ